MHENWDISIYIHGLIYPFPLSLSLSKGEILRSDNDHYKMGVFNFAGDLFFANATSGTPAEVKYWMIVNQFSINHLPRGRKHIQEWNGPTCHRLLMSGLSRLV